MQPLLDHHQPLGGAEIHRLWADRRRARRGVAALLHAAVQPISELSPAVRVCPRGRQPARQAEASLPERRLQDPYEKLTSLPHWEQYLKPGITAPKLERQAQQSSDTEAALRVQKAKLALLSQCRHTR